MTTTLSTPASDLINAASATVTAHAAALRPLMNVAGHTLDNPPHLDEALSAVLYLHASQPTLDATTNDLFRALNAAGVTEPKLARLAGIRRSALTARLESPPPAAPTMPTITPGHFQPRDQVSLRASRESLPTLAGAVGVGYGNALAPLAAVSSGHVPEAAVLDATLEATLHLHASTRDALSALVNPVLAALVLGGARRMSLAELLGCNPATLQRRLAGMAMSTARGADLHRSDNGTWSVQRAAVGRYAGNTGFASRVSASEQFRNPAPDTETVF